MDGGTASDNVEDGHHPLINATIKLFSFSSRVFNKLRSYDMHEQNAYRIRFDGSDRRSTPPPPLLPSMSAWRFWTSGYALVLLVMVSVCKPLVYILSLICLLKGHSFEPNPKYCCSSSPSALLTSTSKSASPAGLASPLALLFSTPSGLLFDVLQIYIPRTVALLFEQRTTSVDCNPSTDSRTFPFTMELDGEVGALGGSKGNGGCLLV